MYRTRLFALLLLSLILSAALPVLAQDALPLTENYISRNKIASFDYPAGWIVEEQNDPTAYLDVAVSSSADVSTKTLGSSGDVFAPGEIRVQFLVLSETTFFQSIKIAPGSRPVDILNALMTQSAPPSDVKMGDVTATSLHDLPGAQVDFTVDKAGEGRIVLVRLRANVLALMAVFTAPGELEQGDVTAQAIFESLTLADELPPAETETPEGTPPLTTTTEALLPQSATSKNGKTTLSYPADWATRTFGSAGIYIASSTKALNHTLGATFAPGEIQILVIVDTVANLTPGIDLGLAADASSAKVLGAFMKATRSFLTFDEPEDTTINDMNAATVVLHGRRYEGRSIIIGFGNNQMGLVQILTAPDELANWDALAQMIATTITHTD